MLWPASLHRSYHFVIALWRTNGAQSNRVKYREIIADNHKKAGWSYGYVSAVDCEGRTIWIVDAHSGNGKLFVVHTDGCNYGYYGSGYAYGGSSRSRVADLQRRLARAGYYHGSIDGGLGIADATSDSRVRAEPQLGQLSQFLPVTGDTWLA